MNTFIRDIALIMSPTAIVMLLCYCGGCLGCDDQKQGTRPSRPPSDYAVVVSPGGSVRMGVKDALIMGMEKVRSVGGSMHALVSQWMTASLGESMHEPSCGDVENPQSSSPPNKDLPIEGPANSSSLANKPPSEIKVIT
ncbi:hypothetical protein BSKO_08109 [Bryopsis sp. KO-2023]|nr:hypothetical protein BSKO_08109 [Bryopsis sp. KO-2023]